MTSYRFIFWLLLSFFVHFPALAAAQTGEAEPRFRPAVVEVKTAGGTRLLKVEVAESSPAWERGMMYRHAWDGLEGMLFVYPDEQIRHMWMRNTYLPLDMVFTDSEGRIVHLTVDAIPGSEEIITSPYPVGLVLELPAGDIARLGLQRGDTLSYEVTGE